MFSTRPVTGTGAAAGPVKRFGASAESITNAGLLTRFETTLG